MNMSVYIQRVGVIRQLPAIAPKKQPAVNRETTLDEILAFFELAKPELPVGRPKSSLKLLRASTLPITPVS